VVALVDAALVDVDGVTLDVEVDGATRDVEVDDVTLDVEVDGVTLDVEVAVVIRVELDDVCALVDVAVGV